MAPASSSTLKSISQLRKQTNRLDEDMDVISISDESSDGDQYGPSRPPALRPPPRAQPTNAVASSSTTYTLPPMKKMFERSNPRPKSKPKLSPPKPSQASSFASKPKPKQRPSSPPPAPPEPQPIASSSSESESEEAEDDDDDDDDDDEMEEIPLPTTTALAAARADDDEEHPALVLQRQEEQEEVKAAGEKRVFKDGKGGAAPPIEISVGGEEEQAGGGEWKGKGKKKGKPLYSPQERLTHLTAHMIHTVALLANAGFRNRQLNDELLKARSLSLIPRSIIKTFTVIHSKTEPDAAKRARAFDKALTGFVDWFAQEWETDFHLGVRGRTWDHAFELPFPLLPSIKTLEKSDPKGKGKARAGGAATDGGGVDLDVWGGELLRTEKSLQKRALQMRGSRDVGAQLFVAAARSLGLGVRLVVSLQSVGWRMGDGVAPKPKTPKMAEGSKNNTAGEELEVERAVEVFEADPTKPVRWIDRKEGERFPGLGNQLGVDGQAVAAGASAKGKAKEIPSALMVRPSKRKLKKLGMGKAKVGEKVVNVDDPFCPLSAPVFWAEVFSRHDQEWIPVDVVRGFIKRTRDFEPVGEGMRNRMVYVVAFEEDGSAKDLTRKYHSQFVAKVPKLRLGLKLKIGDDKNVDWWGDMMRSLQRSYQLQRDITENAVLEKKVKKLGMPTTLAGFKNHPDYVLERDLKASEVIYPKVQHSVFKGEPVYPRSNVLECRSEESWMRDGREVLRGEDPMKYGKMRAVTINKKREIEASKEAGNEMKQALYSLEQTRLYTPPRIKDGKIPKNGFGNIDLFTPTMLPPGAAHLPYKGIAKVAKKLEISYAEAVTGFEYKKQRAIPILTGVVVAEENRDVLMDAYEIANADAEERELIKRKAQVIKRWQKLITDLRIRKKLQAEYGKLAADEEAFRAPSGLDQDETGVQQHKMPSKSKHITVHLPDDQEESSRRFEAESTDEDQSMVDEQPQEPDLRTAKEDQHESSTEDNEEDDDQPVTSGSKIVPSPVKKLVPKSFEEMLAQQADHQDSDLSSEEEDEDGVSPEQPLRSTRSAKQAAFQAPTSASKPYLFIPRITLRRSAPSLPALTPTTRTLSLPKPAPRLAASASSTFQGGRITRNGGRAPLSTGFSSKRTRRDDSESDDSVQEHFSRSTSTAATVPAAGGRALRSRGKKDEDIRTKRERERREREAMEKGEGEGVGSEISD